MTVVGAKRKRQLPESLSQLWQREVEGNGHEEPADRHDATEPPRKRARTGKPSKGTAEAAAAGAGACQWIPNAAHPTPHERYDLAGTAAVNELVLRHLPDTHKSEHPQPHRFRRSPAQQPSAPTTPAVAFALDRYCYNVVRALVHPLHNYLQAHHGRHNADEIQIMLMPPRGPLALAAARDVGDAESGSAAVVVVAAAAHQQGSASVSAPPPPPQRQQRVCYIASNRESLTAGALAAALAGWGTPGALGIGAFRLVRGEAGRHAEQKLLEHLAALLAGDRDGKRPALGPGERALVLGERLPCAVCRVFAVPFEPWAALLPSHGHLYLSTALATPGDPARLAPAAAARTLLERHRGRCLAAK